ncbi:MAG: Gfo/Idh/MocA family oxidoreductase [Oscillospiraceae bacterium]|jgi:predicted dehydrogenase|nr:Gfo/Idh/MocA family oxidoreductase [Oscillospiraceae bacterium]
MRVGIIGCGRITEFRHAPEYTENPDCEIVGCCDTNPERSQFIVNMFGGKAFAAPTELLAQKLDAVSVCAANRDHARLAMEALRSGANVLCEKPMAVTLEECESMVRAAREMGKTLVVGHNQRLAAAHRKAREMIAQGVIGRPLSFRTTFGHSGPEIWTGTRNPWFFDGSRSAFGALADLGAHKIDIVQYLLGEPIVEVTAYLPTLDKTYPDGEPINVDDNAVCIMKTRSGAVGTLHASWTFYPPEDNSTVVYGSKGTIRCFADPAASLIAESKEGKTERFDLDPITTNEDQLSGMRRNTGVIDDFVRAIQTGVPSVNDGASALQTMRVVFAAIRSNGEGHVPVAVNQ